MKISAVILAAGNSERFGENKLFICLEAPLLTRVLRVFSRIERIDEIILVVRQNDKDVIDEMIKNAELQARTVLGGACREESAFLGAKECKNEYLLIHDAARANVEESAINAVIDALEGADGVIPTVNVTSSVVDKKGNYISRNELKAVQTPQGFNKEKLLYAFENASMPLSHYTDDGSVFQEKYPLVFIDGEPSNVKVTYPEDVFGLAGEVRYGSGYDCHSLAEGYKLVLGGMIIPHDKGLVGVSDADVVLHALMDALLNACSLGDIGLYFPPSDPKYQGANSVGLTLKILDVINREGYRPYNVAITILAERPKLSPYVPMIKQNVASILGVPIDRVGVGVTTTEGLGFIGREEGISCYAVCTVRKYKI